MRLKQRSLNVECFLLAEGGVLLNQPEEKLLASIQKHATPPQVIARLGHACSWLFDMLEGEIDQHFRWNYLKISFVNLNPLDWGEYSRTGKFTTNSPELPRPGDQPSALMLHQMVTALRMFFNYLRGSVEIPDWAPDLYICDWVSMTFSKAS